MGELPTLAFVCDLCSKRTGRYEHLHRMTILVGGAQKAAVVLFRHVSSRGVITYKTERPPMKLWPKNKT